MSVTSSGASHLGRIGRLLRTVRFRVTAVASIAMAVVLAAVAVLLLAAQERQLGDNLDASLARRADDLELTLDELAVTPAGERPVVLANASGDDAIVQLVSARDRSVVAATSNATDVPPIATGVDGGADSFRTSSDVPVEDDEYRVLSRAIDLDGVRYDLHVAQNTDEQLELIRGLRATVIVIVPLAALVLAAIVWMLVGRTLRPVEAIRRQVAGMSADRLDRRVPQPGTGDEVDRLASTMNDLIARLEGATRRQQQFVADASHELRSPLTRMRTELEVEAAAPPDRRRPAAETSASVIAEIDELAALVDDLLVLARSDAERAQIEPRPVDLDDVVLDEVRRVRATGGTVTVDQHGVSAALVAGDPGELRRVVRNLLDNAVRHAASTVTVTLGEVGRPGGSTADAVLTVTDDGPGIPPDQAEAVFDRFTRLDDDRSRSGGGTGLGLAIARDIVVRHGGTIGIDPGDPVGTTFRVVLPLADRS